MATWIISITGDNPDHWDFAMADRFWDTRQRRKIVRGDDVYFWQTSPTSQLVSWVRATSEVEPIGNRQPGQWHDSGYLYRFTFEMVDNALTTPVSWKDIQQGAGIKGSPNLVVLQVKESIGEQFLKFLFSAGTSFALAFPQHEIPPCSPKEDLRQHAIREIATRRGQPQFRQSLLDPYSGTCAVTGCAVVDVLEAAHIDRYYGDHSHHVTNGLLLRADVHTLFDLHLITISKNLTVLTAPILAGIEYAHLNGSKLRAPQSSAEAPNLDAVGRHRKECYWAQ